MMFTDIFSKWKESLSFFKKENLKLFVLVGLNNTKRSVGIFFSKFWWLLLLSFVSFTGGLISLFGNNFITILAMNKGTLAGFPPISIVSVLFGLLSLIVLMISFCLLSFVTYLIVRPSIEAKDAFYFKKHFKRIFGFLFLMFFVILLNYLIYATIGAKAIATSSVIFKFFAGILGIVPSLAVFFFLDSQKRLSSVFVSMFKALKAFVYFLPVFMFLSFVFLFLNSLSAIFFPLIKVLFIKRTIAYVSFGVFCAVLFLGFSFVLSFFNLSLIVNYYTMLKHKYYKLFYN